ncbi:MAG: flagellar biosynthetic protein FliQ [Bacillota bacterium]
MVLAVTGEALKKILEVSAPLLIAGLGVGLLVSVLMALTQIHEQTLAFVPKILAVFATLAIFGPWMLTNLVQFMVRSLQAMPTALK